MLRLSPSFLALILTASPIWAGGAAEELWTRKVQPLFDIQCVKCHGPIEQKGGLELDTPAAVLKGGDEGAVLIPGKPEESSLYKNLAEGADPHMPPKKQLTSQEQADVREWIAALAGPQAAPAAKVQREFASIPQAVDTLLTEAWEQQNVKPTADVGDAKWCRRLYLDVVGRIPSSAETEAFLNNSAADRRSSLVDQLLGSEEAAVHLRELWDVFLMGRGKRENSEERREKNGWWRFLEHAFRTDRPWNETVQDMLVGRATEPERSGSSWFLYERKNDHQRIAEAVAPVVYGTKLDCAQCHDHPLAREIKQGHYWGLVAAFNRGKNIEGTSQVAESAVGGFINFTNLKKESQPAVVTLLTGTKLDETWPAENQKVEDKEEGYLDPKAKARVPKNSRRAAFAAVATQDNPLLARAFVNRVWGLLLGRGLVHPVDEMNERNAPSHPELLDWLAADFAKHNYVPRRLLSGLLLSRAYALEQGQAAPASFAAALERPLTGEQIARSWQVAMGLPPQNQELRRKLAFTIPDVLPADYNATFQQAQFLNDSPLLQNLLKPAPGNTTERLASLPTADARVAAAFQAVYSRPPDAEETTAAASVAPPDLLWALLTSAEFLTMP